MLFPTTKCEFVPWTSPPFVTAAVHVLAVIIRVARVLHRDCGTLLLLFKVVLPRIIQPNVPFWLHSHAPILPNYHSVHGWVKVIPKFAAMPMPIVHFLVADLKFDVRILAIWQALLSSFSLPSCALTSAFTHSPALTSAFTATVLPPIYAYMPIFNTN